MNNLTEHPEKSACEALAEADRLGAFELEALTGYPIGDDDLFIFDLGGVRPRDYSLRDLAMLTPGERLAITEDMGNRLDFPCSPVDAR